MNCRMSEDSNATVKHTMEDDLPEKPFSGTQRGETPRKIIETTPY